MPDALPLAPDMGPPAADARAGVCTVGAAPLVINFNVPLLVRLATAPKFRYLSVLVHGS